MKSKSMTTLRIGNSISPESIRGLLLMAVALCCFALPPTARALLPPPTPDGGYPGGHTAEGTNALFNLTTGNFNTADGESALFSNTTGGNNTATGFQSLKSNTTGGDNTANGLAALLSNTTGNSNTATGSNALSSNTT